MKKDKGIQFHRGSKRGSGGSKPDASLSTSARVGNASSSDGVGRPRARSSRASSVGIEVLLAKVRRESRASQDELGC